MKRLSIAALLVLFLCVTQPLSAKGTQEKDFQEAQGKDNFSQTVDLTKLTPGQYNVLVRTRDAAGNVSYAGPYNFYYDPTSDNPLITVANPFPGMRLGSSLNVVGVASAPKGVAKVEAQVDGGDWSLAQGKSFWSFFLNASSMPDGLHRIAVRGTDVNGVVGPVVTVPFHLDQSLPVFTLTTQNSGDRVQGALTLEGTLADGNGLKTLDLSTDDRKTWSSISLQGDGKAFTRKFSLPLDTKKFKDGPLVLWFRGIDGQGSETRRAILFYVDNTVPQVKVLYPPVGKGLHGKVRFAVQAEKILGIRSLSARVGEKGAPVPLNVVPGNPFHVVDLDLPLTGTGTVPVIFEAVDTAGKVGSTTYLAKLDGDLDLAQVTLGADLDKTQVKAPYRLVGTLKATDGPGALAWALNGAAEVVQTVGSAFDFPLPGLVSGTNKLVLVPIDALGRRGKPVPMTFTAVLDPASVQFEAVVFPDKEVPFQPGLAVGPEKKAKVRGTVTVPNPVKSAAWSLGDGKEVPLVLAGKGPAVPFVLPLPDDPPFGTATLTLRVEDIYGQVTKAATFLDITNLAKPQGPEGMAFADPRMGNSPLVITPDSPLRGSFSGGKVKTAELTTPRGTVPTSVLTVSHDDQYVVIKALKDGQFDGVKLKVVTDKGRIYETDLGKLMGDVAAPTIGLLSPLSGGWVRENLRIDGQAADGNGVTRLEWSTDNGANWQSLEPPPGLGGPFTRQLTLPGSDGVVNLLVRATDPAGRVGTFVTTVRKDTQGPAVDLTLPVASTSPGLVYAAGRFKDEGALQKAEVLINKKVVALPLDRPFLLTLDPQATSTLMFHVVDWAGNVTDQEFTLPTAADAAPVPATAKPEVQILFPKADTKGLAGVVPVVGRVVGFGTPPTLTVKGEAAGDQTLTLTDAGYFTFETNDVQGLKSRQIVVSGAGAPKETASVTLNLPYDPAGETPVARFLAQGEKPVLTGNVAVSGWIGDPRGVVSWAYQLDGGEKKTVVPDPAKPPVGSFLVDLGVPPVGAHKLTVIPVNGQGKEGAPVSVEFVATVPSGPVEFTNFDLGAPLVVTKDTKVQGRIGSLNAWKKLEVRFADLAQPDPWNGPFTPLTAAKGGDGTWTFDVAVPQGLPFSRIGVLVRGEDALGQKVEGRTLFHRVWPKDPASIQDTEGLFFVDDRLDTVSGRFNTIPGQPLSGTFRGRPIKSVTLNPPQPALTAEASGTTVRLGATDPGLYPPVSVVVTTVDNETFTSPPITVFADLGGPVIELQAPANGDWIRDKVAVLGRVSDPSEVATVEASVDGGTVWTPLVTKAGLFNTVLPDSGPDGLTRVLVRAVDRGGHTTVESRALTKDGTAPEWALVAPPADHEVNGLTTLIGTATDLNPIVSVESSDDGKVFKPADGTATFTFDLDFASYAKLPEKFYIRTTDSSGNQAVTPLVVPLNQETDKPVVQIQTPAEGEVVRTDFNLSGMAFDDDGIKALSWRVDNGPWLKLDGANSFQIPIALSTLADNEHTVEVQAEDIYGTKGNVAKTKFRVSLAAPTALLHAPEIDKTVSGVVGLVGASFDRNGLQGVQISLDNGLTWNRAELKAKETFVASLPSDQLQGFTSAQRQEWEWRFDSRTLKDGTYLVMVKSTDAYGTEGLFTTLVNLDNTAPTLTLTNPSDGEPVLDTLNLEGRSADNIALVSLRGELRPIEAPGASSSKSQPLGAALMTSDLPVTPTFNQHWSLGTLAPGWYNLRLEARDAAGNSTYVARNIRIEGASADKVELLYPQSGETLAGSFLIEGHVTSRSAVTEALVNLDEKTKIVTAVDENGYFSAPIDGANLPSGIHLISITVQQSPTVTLTSESRKVSFDPVGPWVKVGSHRSGAYVAQRPFLSGTAGWVAAPLADGASAEDKRAYDQAAEGHRVNLVEVSLDNGKTFTPAQGTSDWKYRLESLALPDGPLPLIFRATFANGSVAIQRLLVTVSQTPPTVQLLTNIENGRFNGTLDLAGFSDGEGGQIKAVEVAVRQGDKAGYEVPSFIQGMYLDVHLLGATYWETGLGLTFFQDAVKIQAEVGQAPEGRFWGTVAGVKLIASVAQLPAGYFFGPDWSWLSSSFGVGANFSLFSMTPQFLDFSSTNPVVLGGIVLQWETARATLKDWTFLKSYAWYNEATVWFISSDVQASAMWLYATGIRVGLF